jgi:hypothetical protein
MDADLPSLPVMIRLTTWKTLAIAAFAATLGVSAQERDKEFDAVDGPNVRMMRHEDGSRTMFTRTPDNKRMTKKKFSSGGVLTMKSEYWMYSNGNPKMCHIFDGKGNMMFKVQYGYRKSDMQLVRELMWDARVKRIDPNTGKEMPIQRIEYLYNAQGERSAPIVINLLPGKTFEEVFGVKSSALETNPFRDEAEGVANPNARKVGKGQ